MFNSDQSEMWANKARQQYTPMVLFLHFSPLFQSKWNFYTMKVPMKSNIFCMTLFSKNSCNMQMSYTLIEYAKHTPKSKIHYQIHPPILHPIILPMVMAVLLLDWPPTWKLPGLVVPARVAYYQYYCCIAVASFSLLDSTLQTLEVWCVAHLVWNPC